MSGLEQERLARAALNRLGEPGEVRLARLVAELGARTVYDHLLEDRELDGMRTDLATRLAGLDPARDLEHGARLGLRFVIPGDAEWPVGLDALDGADPVAGRGGSPLGIWVRGSRRLDELTRAIAIVGSRSATSYGENMATTVASEVAAAGWTVVSGAAFGIDSAAHRGALSGRGPTIAVLACGADRVYPAAHRRLLDHVLEHGAVVSEAAPGSMPTRVRFLARNRLIAALARGTVVVEAAARSGALSTAHWTRSLNRSLSAVPGPCSSATSQGTHELIRNAGATLVTSAAEVLELVAPAGESLPEPVRGPDRARDRLTRRQQQVLDAVPVSGAASEEAIARTAGIGLDEVRECLVTLAGAGFAVPAAHGWRLGASGRE